MTSRSAIHPFLPTPHSSAIKGGAAAVALAAVAALWMLLPIGTYLESLAAAVRGAGAIGVLAFVVVYIVATVLLVPGTALTLAAGFAWGPWLGLAIVSPAATIASVIAFAIARFLARGWVERKLEGHARFAAVDRAVSESGFKIVALLRLSPLFPFNLLNYALGLTNISLTRYTLASLLGMLPGTALYVYLGSLVTTATGLTGGRPRGGAASVLYWVGLAATLLVTIVVTRLARRELNRRMPPGDPAKATEAR